MTTKSKILSDNELFACKESSSWQLGSYYPNLKCLSTEAFLNIIQENSQKAYDSPGALLFRHEDAFLILTPREFDSEHYQLKMWRISALVAKDQQQLASLFAKLESAISKNKIDFISIEIDFSNSALIKLLEEYDYCEVVTKRATIFNRSERARYTPIKAIFEVRPVKESDWPEIREIAVASAALPTLEKDPKFVAVAKNCDRSVYYKWIDKFSSGEWIDAAMVAVRRGKIKGLVAFRYDKILKAHTGKVITDGSGIGFATKDGVGAYVNIMDRLADFYPEVEVWIFETTLDNKLVLKYCKKRNLQHIGDRIIFHRVLARPTAVKA